jgi:hypothetical protein
MGNLRREGEKGRKRKDPDESSYNGRELPSLSR